MTTIHDRERKRRRDGGKERERKRDGRKERERERKRESPDPDKLSLVSTGLIWCSFLVDFQGFRCV